MKVAGTDFDPGVRNAHERLCKIVVAESACAQHGACTGTMGAVGQRAATRLKQRSGHSSILLRGLFRVWPCTYFPKKLGPSSYLMMAPKLSCAAVLGGHHLYVTPRTMTGIIRTTARDTMLRKDDAEADRTFEMAQRNIADRHQDNRMWA